MTHDSDPSKGSERTISRRALLRRAVGGLAAAGSATVVWKLLAGRNSRPNTQNIYETLPPIATTMGFQEYMARWSVTNLATDTMTSDATKQAIRESVGAQNPGWLEGMRPLNGQRIAVGANQMQIWIQPTGEVSAALRDYSRPDDQGTQILMEGLKTADFTGRFPRDLFPRFYVGGKPIADFYTVEAVLNATAFEGPNGSIQIPLNDIGDADEAIKLIGTVRVTDDSVALMRDPAYSPIRLGGEYDPSSHGFQPAENVGYTIRRMHDLGDPVDL